MNGLRDDDRGAKVVTGSDSRQSQERVLELVKLEVLVGWGRRGYGAWKSVVLPGVVAGV